MEASPVVLLFVSVLLVVLGLVVYRQWRVIGQIAGEMVDSRLLFGPWGERVLMPLAMLAVGAGVMGITHAVLRLI